MEKTRLTREFIHEKGQQKISLADPNPDMTADQVLAFYSATYPELNNATVNGPTYRGDKQVFTFRTTVGTKG